MPPDRPPHRAHPHPYAREAESAAASPSRPAPTPHSTAHSSTTSPNGSRSLIPTTPLYPLLSQIRIHILPTKLDGQLPTTYARVEALGGIISPAADASIIVTVLRGRPRLLKVLGSAQLVDSRWIVGLEWVTRAYDAVVAYHDALDKAGLKGDEEATEVSKPALNHAPLQQPYIPPPLVPSREAYAIPSTGTAVRNPPAELPVISDAEDATTMDTRDLAPFPVDIDLRDIPNRAVQRCSPLTCVNQDIVSLSTPCARDRCGGLIVYVQIDAIKPIYQLREYDDPDQRNSNVLSYKRSMSVSLCARVHTMNENAFAEFSSNVDPKMWASAKRANRRPPLRCSSLLFSQKPFPGGSNPERKPCSYQTSAPKSPNECVNPSLFAT